MPGREVMTSERCRELLIDSRGWIEAVLARIDHLGHDGGTVEGGSYRHHGDHIEALEELVLSSESPG